MPTLHGDHITHHVHHITSHRRGTCMRIDFRSYVGLQRAGAVLQRRRRCRGWIVEAHAHGSKKEKKSRKSRGRGKLWGSGERWDGGMEAKDRRIEAREGPPGFDSI